MARLAAPQVPVHLENTQRGAEQVAEQSAQELQALRGVAAESMFDDPMADVYDVAINLLSWQLHARLTGARERARAASGTIDEHTDEHTDGRACGEPGNNPIGMVREERGTLTQH